MKIFISCILIVIVFSCRDPFESPVTSPDNGYLVVEGFINAGVGGTSISLSRINKLNQPAIIRVRAAAVQVENESNQVFPLSEKTPGVYANELLQLDTSSSYRLRIRTPENKIYLSALAKARITPVIDSVSWKYDNDGVVISANTHDASNNTRYYRWEFEQAWEIQSSFNPTVRIMTTPMGGGFFYSAVLVNPNGEPDTSRFRCWQYNNSTSILLGSTAKLSKDVISMPLIFIQKGSLPLSVLYSVLVKQYAISKAEYEFLDIMKKNTELTGSVFDPQPSQLKGNIECISDPSEHVVGYVGVSSLEQRRIFIYNKQLPAWDFKSGCFEVLIDNHTDSISKAVGMGLTSTIIGSVSNSRIATFYMTLPVCVDCTLRGTSKKPAFWP